jgi:hypothetical protein
MISDLLTLTSIHTALSLIALLAGIVVTGALLNGRTPPGWTAAYLITGVLTSATGFLFPFVKFLPSHGFSIICLVLLAVAIYALYSKQLAGSWSWIYAASIVATVYLDAFVGVVQSFIKVPLLASLAPTQSEPPFAVVQGILLLMFVVLGIGAARAMRRAAPTAAYA